jgi:hypothetical protein
MSFQLPGLLIEYRGSPYPSHTGNRLLYTVLYEYAHNKVPDGMDEASLHPA